MLHLRRGFGFHGEFKDVNIMAKAAMFRASVMEDSRNGGLRCQERAAQMKESYKNTKYFLRSHDWGCWCDRAFVTQMAEHQNNLRRKQGITKNGIEQEISRNQAQPWDPAMALRVRRTFQRQVTQKLASGTTFNAEERVRSNLCRFGL